MPLSKRNIHDDGDISNDDLDDSSKYDNGDICNDDLDDFLNITLMIVLMMTMMIALVMTIMMILLMLTRPCVNRVVPPPTHLSRHSYNLNITTCSKLST